MGLTISDTGLSLIKKWEGRYLKAYQDCVGVWTIGYGMIDSDYKYTGLHVKKGVTITDKQCDDLFEKLIRAKYCPLVDKYQSKYNFNQNQYDALVSFAYNIGSIDGLTANGTRSKETVGKKILAYNKAGGKVVQGLVNRRKDEYALYTKAVSKSHYTGSYPKMPPRGYYAEGDGSTHLKDWTIEINKVLKVLKWAGFYSGKIDGVYGPKAVSATIKCQEHFKLKTNGKFGNLCLGSLMAYKK